LTQLNPKPYLLQNQGTVRRSPVDFFQIYASI
jgi:hypothetical protein